MDCFFNYVPAKSALFPFGVSEPTSGEKKGILKTDARINYATWMMDGLDDGRWMMKQM
jgi:hypothetical protein